MSQTLDETQLAAWRTLITAHALLVERIDQELIAAGCVPLHWYDVLIELAEAPERRLRMHELAERVVLSRSTLTRLVGRLEEEGLLVRERHDSDRRGVYAALTASGLDALRRAWPVYARGIATHFARHLGEAEARTLTEALARVLDAIRA